jgi:hypothetical protein
MAHSNDRLQSMSTQVLRDLGTSDQAIVAYLGRFGADGRQARGGHADGLNRAEPATELPFAGGYWHWGVRARHSDFW